MQLWFSHDRRSLAPEVTPGGSRLGSLSGGGLPVNQQAFLDAARCSLDASFRTWGPRARSEFEASTFVEDRGQIPKSKKITLKRACWQVHFGVCKRKDSDIYAPIVSSGVSLTDFIWEHDLQFQWVLLELIAVDEPGGIVASGYYWCAYSRGANPKLTLFIAGGFG